MFLHCLKKSCTALAILALLTGCGRNIDHDHYAPAATSGRVFEGVVVSSRPVKVSPENLQDNTVGAIGGGALGAVAGAQFGRGSGSLAGGIVGALLGGLAGTAVQGAANTVDATEYIVKLDEETTMPVAGGANSQVGFDGRAVAQGAGKTKMVSVVQKDSQTIAPGSLIYVIYSADRPRITLR